MIQIRSVLKVLDGSGVREVRSFDLPGKAGSPGRIGDKVTASVFRLRAGSASASNFKKGEVVRGVLVTTKKGVVRQNGQVIRFPENGVVLLTKKGEPMGQRVRGCLPYDLRQKGYLKLVRMADSVV